jgi:hypothetical protein
MQWGFWLDTVERTVRTVVQASAAAVLATWIEAGNWDGVQFAVVWKVAAFAAVLTLLMALAGKPIGNTDSPSVLEPTE